MLGAAFIIYSMDWDVKHVIKKPKRGVWQKRGGFTRHPYIAHVVDCVKIRSVYIYSYARIFLCLVLFSLFCVTIGPTFQGK